jgi:hypothetical protein
VARHLLAATGVAPVSFYNGTLESFMDRYGNAIYLTPMALGAIASISAAAWRFLGVRANDTAQTTLEALCGLRVRIRHLKRDIKIGRGTHLMHLETMRFALWGESINFLDGADAVSIPA